jgi:hypothetical protein
MIPETYIVRIYRRTGGPQQQIAGSIETPSGASCAGFASLTELMAILGAPKAHLQPAAPSDAAGSSEMKSYRQEDDEG